MSQWGGVIKWKLKMRWHVIKNVSKWETFRKSVQQAANMMKNTVQMTCQCVFPLSLNAHMFDFRKQRLYYALIFAIQVIKRWVNGKEHKNLHASANKTGILKGYDPSTMFCKALTRRNSDISTNFSSIFVEISATRCTPYKRVLHSTQII